jgi:hypothetical protein
LSRKPSNPRPYYALPIKVQALLLTNKVSDEAQNN